MLHIPILRAGKPYTSLETVEIVDHATGEPVAMVSQANAGLIARDMNRIDEGARALQQFSARELIRMCVEAGEIFMTATLPLGDSAQSPEEYVRCLSSTTGMPQALCKLNVKKIHGAMTQMEAVLAGLTRGLDLSILDNGYGQDADRLVSYFSRGDCMGAVLPSNSPGVHTLWLPAFALKVPLVLKPGREEPWTPYRIVQALLKAGAPAEAFGYYPTNHAGSNEILMRCGRGMLFGGEATTKPWAGNGRIQLHGPGYSKILIGEDKIDKWETYLDVIATSIAANGGRSCINASGVWVPKYGRQIAEALADKFADFTAKPADNPQAKLAAFANPQVAQTFSTWIDGDLDVAGAEDVTQHRLGRQRLAHIGRCAYLLPTIVHCERPNHPLAHREFLFPYASVVECPQSEMLEQIGPTLVATAITDDKAFVGALLASGHVDRLNIGPIPTMKIGWDQPHEGNLFEHLYTRRAFQIEQADVHAGV